MEEAEAVVGWALEICEQSYGPGHPSVATGGARALFEDAGADEHSGRPSPARDELAFVSNRDGAFDVFVGQIGSGRFRNLTGGEDDPRSPGDDVGFSGWQ